MNMTFVASFDWHVNDKLGLASIYGRQMLMSNLVYSGGARYGVPLDYCYYFTNGVWLKLK